MQNTRTQKTATELLQIAAESLTTGRKLLQQTAKQVAANPTAAMISELQAMVAMCEQLEVNFKAALEAAKAQ